MNFLRPKNIFATFSPIYKLNGRRFIFCHVKFQMTPIYVCSNIKYWTIFYIWINSFLFLIKRILNCELQDETINHIFVECKFAIKLWSDLRYYCQCSFDVPILNPQIATFGFFEIDNFFWNIYYYYTNTISIRHETFQSFHLQYYWKNCFFSGKRMCQDMKEKPKLSLKHGVRWCN